MGISPANKKPGVFLTVSFGNGPQASGAAPRRIVFLGYAKKVGQGQAQAGIDLTFQGPLESPDQAATFWGWGSEMHQQVDAAIDQDGDVTLFGVSYPEAVGGAYSETTITIAGNNGLAAGSLLLYVNGNPRYVEVPIPAGATPAAQATAIYQAFQTRKELPCYAPTPPAGAACVIRWNHKGARGNQLVVRYVADGISGSTYTIAQTNVGATDSDPSAAFDVFAAEDAAFIVCPDQSTSTSVGLPRWVQYANQRADPLNGKRSVIVAACTGSLATATTLSTSVNAHRCTIAWCPGAEDTAGRIAARYAVYIVKGTELDIAANLIKGGIDGTVLRNFRGPYDDSLRITDQQATAALNVGLTPIMTYKRQPTVGVVLRPITSRFQTIDGNPDYACLNLNCVLVPDDIANDLDTDIMITFAGWKLADDDPTEPNDEPIPYVLRPSIFDEELKRKLRIRAARGQLVRVEAMIAAGLVRSVIHPMNPDRMLTANLPLQVINWFAQWEAVLRQTTRAA